MAEEQEDDSSKTEEPTQRKLDEARKKGEIATSKEVNNWFMIMAIAIIVMIVIPIFSHQLIAPLRMYIERPEDFLTSDQGFTGIGLKAAMLILGLLIIPTILILGAILLSYIIQNGIVFSTTSIEPKLERISILSGFKRIFSMTSIVEFVKAIFKLCIVGSVTALLMLPVFHGLDQIITMSPVGFMDRTHNLSIRLVIGVLAVLTVIAIIDWIYQRQTFLKKMRMSRHELKEEFKQSEGDPHVKRRLAEIRNERARKRMMAAVPEATVIVTNPTHYAVAIKYDQDKEMAPMLVAKGKNEVAQRIREVAEEHNIPILQNPPVARSLFKDVEIDEEIPREYYEIVAKIVGYVLRLKGKIPGAPGRPPTAPPDDVEE